MNKDRAVFKMLWPDECYHIGAEGTIYGPCIYCGLKTYDSLWRLNTNLTAWEGFGLMWERAQECEWWEEFYLTYIHYKHHWHSHARGCNHMIIHPTRFRDALYDFGISKGLIPKEESNGNID